MAEKPILILQQTEASPPAMIDDVLRRHGRMRHILRPMQEPIPRSLGRFAGLVVMSGHVSANDMHLPFIAQQIRLLRWCIRYDFPVLAIGLGARMLARAGGAEVVRSRAHALGWKHVVPTFLAGEDPLFEAMPIRGLELFQWHTESFQLPSKALLLATADETPFQAFRLGQRQYGLQFHAEITEELIRGWLDSHTAEAAALGVDGIAQLLRGIPKYLPFARMFCRHLVEAWLALADRAGA